MYFLGSTLLTLLYHDGTTEKDVETTWEDGSPHHIFNKYSMTMYGQTTIDTDSDLYRQRLALRGAMWGGERLRSWID
ncbi:unnamed protein product [Auanema sp. JU1783]|nr:unnamed protein product [Auanema sp. JU1783]